MNCEIFRGRREDRVAYLTAKDPSQNENTHSRSLSPAIVPVRRSLPLPPNVVLFRGLIATHAASSTLV